MWSSTSQRIKALMSARQRERDRLSRPIHVRRTDLVLIFADEDGAAVEVPARAMLNDLSPDGFSVYSATKLNSNVEIAVALEHPKPFQLVAKVLCSQYQPSSSHVLTAQSYPYRITLALLWKEREGSSVTREEFAQFCKQLSDLYVSKKGIFLEEAFEAGAQTQEASTPPPQEAEEARDESAEASVSEETREAA
jgi:hypothetical protein